MPTDGLSVGLRSIQVIFGNAGRWWIGGLSEGRAAIENCGSGHLYYPQWLPPVVYEEGIGILQDRELSCQNGMQGRDHRSFWSDLMLNPKLRGGTLEFLLPEHNRRDCGGWKWLPATPEDKGTLVERGFEQFGYQVTPGIKVALGLIIEITELTGATI